ncbi:hypothetical protein GCM10010211_31920 [Streptomyces albospinus]|uniref:Uncharacterized protein n=1 Tax=Streptomyces albospinus TaxID=285515 RepID=A0ABQ2V4D2_9ACTN|nr:hypothetical protein GCM10010211_31920 [Streptomyces albospinus]
MPALLDEPEGALSPELLALVEPEQPATSSTGTAAQVRRLASRLAERCMVPSLFVVVESARTLVERVPCLGDGAGLEGTVRGGARGVAVSRRSAREGNSGISGPSCPFAAIGTYGAIR